LDENEEDDNGSFKRANAEELAKRKIIKAKL
jgi:hypothetical protein